jgi:hypothetical protein
VKPATGRPCQCKGRDRLAPRVPLGRRRHCEGSIRDEARDLFAPVYRWFNEGFDTLDLKQALSRDVAREIRHRVAELLPRLRQSCAMLIAARTSKDFACCSRATASARSKYAFGRVRNRRLERDFPGHATDLGLAPSLLGCFHPVIAAPIPHQASSN